MSYQLKNQKFFMKFNRFFFPWLYIGHWGKETIIVKAGPNHQIKVRVNSSDILLIWEIWKFNVYQDANFPIKPTDIVVDIGAHIGVFAIWAAARANQGQVYAYEASPSNFSLLLKNIALNQKQNLHAVNQAVNGQAGDFYLYQPGKNGGLGSLIQDHSSHREKVKATTLDFLIEAHKLDQIDFLKVDVEGAEYPIFFNCSPESLRKVNTLVLEYHRFEGYEWQPDDLIRFLKSHDFKVVQEPGLFFQEKLFGTGIIKAWRPDAFHK